MTTVVACQWYYIYTYIYKCNVAKLWLHMIIIIFSFKIYILFFVANDHAM
jgi:hypothetical protein